MWYFLASLANVREKSSAVPVCVPNNIFIFPLYTISQSITDTITHKKVRTVSGGMVSGGLCLGGLGPEVLAVGLWATGLMVRGRGGGDEGVRNK